MGFGSDASGFLDLDANLTFLSGEVPEQIALSQAVARRFITPRGGLYYDQAYGLDLRLFVGSSASPRAVEKMISAEARKDERVQDCLATIVVSGNTWTVAINCTSVTGATFAFTLTVDQVTVTLLEGS